jgi:hypothetical protein
VSMLRRRLWRVRQTWLVRVSVAGFPSDGVVGPEIQ